MQRRKKGHKRTANKAIRILQKIKKGENYDRPGKVKLYERIK